MDDVGDLPVGWVEAPLGSMVAVTNDAAVPSATPTMRFVGMEHVEAETGRLTGDTDPVAIRSSSFVVDPGQVLYGRLRPYLNKVFVPVERIYASREFIPMQPSEGLVAAFLTYRLRAQDFVDFAVSLNSGDRPRVKWPQIEQFSLKCPPLPEQHRIVEILEEQLSRIDAALESVRLVREKAAQFRRSLLHAAFTGALTGVRVEPGALPQGWCEVTLADINDPDRPICYGILMPGPDLPGGIPYVKVRNMRDGRVNLEGIHHTSAEIDDKYARSRLNAGDLLVSIRGTFGRVAVVPQELDAGNLTQDTARVAPVGADHGFLYYYLQAPQAQDFFRAVARGVAVKGVNIRDLRQLPIPLPPKEEQTQLVTAIKPQLDRIDALLAVVDTVEQGAAALRRSLLHAAFTGRLTEQWRQEHAHV